MIRSMAGKLSTDILTGPLGYVGRRVRLGKLGPLSEVPFNVRTLAEAGVIHPVRPDKLAQLMRVLARWGASPAAGIAGGAINQPGGPLLGDAGGARTLAGGHPRSQPPPPGPARRGGPRGRRGRGT